MIQDAATPKLTRRPIDLGRIMGTPTPRPQPTEPDQSWLDVPVNAPEAEMTESPSWWTPSAMGRGLADAFTAIPRGAVNAAAAAGNLVNAGARLLPGVDETTLGGMFAPIPNRPLGESETTGARITESIVQFGTGFALGGPAVKAAAGAAGASTLLTASGGLSLTGAAAAGAVTDFAAFDGHAGRMADLIARIPGMEEPMRRTGMLTSDEDSEFVGRLKNSLDGVGVGAAFQAILNLTRFGRAVAKARAAGKPPDVALADAHAAVPDVQKSLAELDDMRTAETSPFRGQAADDALVKSQTVEQIVNVDGTPAIAVEGFVPLSSKTFHPSDTSGIIGFINQHGTLLDNPQATIRIAQGDVQIGLTLRPDQASDRIVKSLTPDMTPRQLGEAAQNITKAKQAGPPNPEPPVTGGGAPVVAAPRLTPHQIYLGEVGFDAKTADEIGEILQGEFVEGVAARGQVALRFKSKGEPFTDAVNPKRMSREELLSRELRKKGLNLEGLKGRPEVLAQSMRALENMNVALREAENPALVKETFAEMSVRAQSEMDTIFGIASSWDRSSYLKQAEKAGVDAANRVGAQAKAANDIAAGIAIDLHAKSVEFAARRKANQPIQKWEIAAWAESRGLADDALSMGASLKNALAHNLYMQRGEIIPTSKAPRMTAVQLQGDEDAIERILMENGGENKIMSDAAKIAAAGGRDLSQIANTLQLARGSHGLLGATIETGYAAMLSGLGTPISQMFGNLSVAAYLPFRRGFSAAVHLPFTRNPQTVDALKGEIAEAVGTYMGMFRSIPEAMHAYKTGFMQGPTLTPRGGVFDVSARAKMQNVSSRAAGVGEDTAEGLLLDAVGDLLSVPGRALQGGDEMVRVLAYRGTAQSKLTRTGLEQGLDGKALGSFVSSEMDRLIYKGQALSLDQLERRAVDQVQREGYTGVHFIERKNRLISEWQTSDWYKRLSGLSEFAAEQGAEASMSKSLDPRTLGGGIQKVLSRHPILAFTISPFHKTSVNIAKFALQHFDFHAYGRWMVESRLNKPGTPYAETTNRLLADMRSGDPIRQANARGRLLLGTTFASGVAAMYMSGMIVGRGPADKKLRAQKMEDGWLPYSFHINGKYYSYKRLEPIATILGLVADVSQSLEDAPDDRVPELGDVAMGVCVALAANLTNKSYAKGLADFTQAITSPSEYMEDFLGSIATRFVPNILRDVETAIDPTFHEIRGVHDAMIAKIPWMANELEPRRNILGEPIQRAKKLGEDALGSWVAPFSIMQVGKGSDALKSELASMEYAFSVPGSKRGGYDMFDIKASNGQSSYDRWMENSGTIRLGGKNLRQMLELTIASPGYQRLSADSLDGEPSARASRLKTIIERYRRSAMLQTQREIPELNQAELGYRLERARMR